MTHPQILILDAMKNISPKTPTHSEMASIIGLDAHTTAMNMDAMAKAGNLELVRDGSELKSDTKNYRLP